MNYPKLSFTVLTASALFLSGCMQYPMAPPPPVKVKPKPKPKPKKHVSMPKAPKKEIELKEVEDDNFSSDYMYPDAKKKESAKVKEKAPAPTESTVAANMSNKECISMIGQEKFDKYSAMFGGTAGALKKCQMLKAL